jgi:hypothetical protein
MIGEGHRSRARVSDETRGQLPPGGTNAVTPGIVLCAQPLAGGFAFFLQLLVEETRPCLNTRT